MAAAKSRSGWFATALRPTPENSCNLSKSATATSRAIPTDSRMATSRHQPPQSCATHSREADHSVVIVQVGFSTNLARLLDSPPDDSSPLTGRQLVSEKVRLLSVMAGWFASDPLTHERPAAEYNIVNDVAAAQQLAEAWPTPIVWSGFEIGRAIEYPAESIDDDYNYVPHHPVAEAYRLYNPPPHNRPTWDLTSALYAVRPTRGYFGLGPPGRVTISADGHTSFAPDDAGPHRLLTATAAQITRSREAFVQLSSQPPTPTPSPKSSSAPNNP